MVKGKFLKTSKSQNVIKVVVGEMKKGNPNLKSKDQISAIQNVEIYFDLRKEIIDFLLRLLFFAI